MNDNEKDKLVEQIISTSAGRKWLVKQAEEAGVLDKLGEAIIASVNEMGDAYRQATENNRKWRTAEGCSWCQNRGWWQDELSDQHSGWWEGELPKRHYCECPLGQKLKEEESDGIRREDK